MNQTGNKGAVVLTGASRGIGASVARKLGSRGVAVCINHSNSSDEAEAVRADIAAGGGQAHVVQADLRDESAILRLFAEVEATLGQLYGLVNNAGYVGQAGRRVENVEAHVLKMSFETNVIAPFLCAREALRRMSTKHGGSGGRIINVSSLASRTGSANDWVDYAASKAALNTFTLGLAREVAREGVRVNAVSPGVVNTSIHEKAGAPDRLERIGGITPIGRAAEADEVADLIVWLLLDAPDYITGSVYDIAGGL